MLGPAVVLLVVHGVGADAGISASSSRRLQQDLIPCSQVAFSPRVAISTSVAAPRFVTGADVDADGDVDIVSAAEFGGVSWHENDGTATFVTRTIDPFADGAWAVDVADLDNDGDLDVVAALSDLNQCAWYSNNGDNTFTKIIVAGGFQVVSVAVADLDGDSDNDIAAALWGSSEFVWYESNGHSVPTFTERLIDGDAFRARAVVVADVDGDANLDVVAASGGDDTIAYYKNIPGTPATFDKRVITSTADGPRGVAAGDMDGDNDVDVLSASIEDNTVAWYENNGFSTPTFTKRIIAQDRDGVWAVNVADLDGDQDLDCVAASAYDDIVEWFENDGSGSFTDFLISRTTDFAYHVDAADLDGDLDLDVMTAAVNDDIVGWHENVCLETPPTAQPVGPPTLAPTAQAATPGPSQTPPTTPRPTASPPSYVPTTYFPSGLPTVEPTYAPTVSLAPTSLPDRGLLPGLVTTSKKKTANAQLSSAALAVSLIVGSIVLLLLLVVGGFYFTRRCRGEPVTAFVVSSETSCGLEMK